MATLADMVVGFLFDYSNGDVVLQQCQRDGKPRWPTTGLVHHVSTLAACRSHQKPGRLATSTGATEGVMTVKRIGGTEVYDVAQGSRMCFGSLHPICNTSATYSLVGDILQGDFV